MADRHTFHFRHLKPFTQWLERNGWEMQRTTNYEILKASKDRQWVIAYKKLDAKEHFTLTENSIYWFNKWLNERKIRAEFCEQIREIASRLAKPTTEYDDGSFDYDIDATQFDYILQAFKEENYALVEKYIEGDTSGN